MRKNKNVLIVALIAVVNALGYGIIIPVLYTYSRKFGLTDFQNSLLFSLFAVCQFIATPIIGRMSDRYGRRPLLIFSLLGTAVSFFMTAWAPNVFFLFLSRALDGITAGNLPVASAVVSDSTEQKDRAKGFGIIGAAFGFGFVFGPAISAGTVSYSAQLPFIIAGTMASIAVIVTFFFLPETNKHIGQVSHKKLFDLSRLWHALFDGEVGRTLLITLLFSSAFGSFISSFQPLAYKIFHLSTSQVSTVFTIFGVVSLIVQAFLLGKITKWFPLKSVFMFGLCLVGTVFTGIFLNNNLLMFMVLCIGLAFGNSLVNPLTQTILSRETDAKSQGSIMGLHASYMSIGQIIGPPIGGFVGSYGLHFPFLFSGIMSFTCLILSFNILKHVKKESMFV